jgi:hypothetical protein
MDPKKSRTLAPELSSKEQSEKTNSGWELPRTAGRSAWWAERTLAGFAENSHDRIWIGLPSLGSAETPTTFAPAFSAKVQLAKTGAVKPSRRHALDPESSLPTKRLFTNLGEALVTKTAAPPAAHPPVTVPAWTTVVVSSPLWKSIPRTGEASVPSRS